MTKRQRYQDVPWHDVSMWASLTFSMFILLNFLILSNWNWRLKRLNFVCPKKPSWPTPSKNLCQNISLKLGQIWSLSLILNYMTVKIYCTITIHIILHSIKIVICEQEGPNKRMLSMEWLLNKRKKDKCLKETNDLLSLAAGKLRWTPLL